MRLGGAVLAIYTMIAWIVNLVTFIGCDFDPVGKEEILKGIGIFILPLAWFTAWM